MAFLAALGFTIVAPHVNAQSGAIRFTGGTTVGGPSAAAVMEGGVAVSAGKRLELTGNVGHIRDIKSKAQDRFITQLPGFLGAPVEINARFPVTYASTGVRFALVRRRLITNIEGGVGIARIGTNVRATLNGVDLSSEIRDFVVDDGEISSTKPLVHVGVGLAVPLTARFQIEGGYRLSHFYWRQGVNTNAVLASVNVQF